MKINIAEFLNGALAPELLVPLQEAFDKKIEDVRGEVESDLRSEFAQRYENDKSQLVEAIDRMVTDTLTGLKTEHATEVKKLSESRDDFRAARKDCAKSYKKKISEHLALIDKFAVQQIGKEAQSLQEQKISSRSQAEQLAEDLESAKLILAKKHTAHMRKIDEFVTRQLTKELNEFQQDKRALVETRLKLVKEGRTKLAETQTRLIREGAKKIEKVVASTLNREMTEMHEDIERNRQNMFGRRIFEAVATEFLTSYFAEGTEVRKLQNVLEAQNKEVASNKAEMQAIRSKLSEASQAIDTAKRKAKLAEASADRSKIMSELLAPLRGEKRAVMEQMLETTRTENLRESYRKLVPVVLAEGSRKVAPEAPKPLIEGKTERRPVALTGDKRPTRMFESNEADTLSVELSRVSDLAGIRR